MKPVFRFLPLVLALSLLAGCAGEGEASSQSAPEPSSQSAVSQPSSQSAPETSGEASSAASQPESQPARESSASGSAPTAESQTTVEEVIECYAYAPLLEESPDGYTVEVGRMGRDGNGETYPLTDPAALEETVALLLGAQPLPPEEQIDGEFYENSIYSIIVVDGVEYRFTDWGQKESVLYRAPAQGEVPVLYEPADPAALYSWNEEVLTPVLEANGAAG